jgi:hypothetical protein
MYLSCLCLYVFIYIYNLLGMYDAGWGYDPCREDVSYWGLDKPTVVAELPADSAHYTATQMIDCAYANGFYGDMFWAYNGGGG